MRRVNFWCRCLLAAGAVVAVALIALGGQDTRGAAADGGKLRGLFVVGQVRSGYSEDAEHLRTALLFGTNWAEQPQPVIGPLDGGALRTAVKDAFTGAADNDVSLFFYSDHGSGVGDAFADDNDDEKSPQALNVWEEGPSMTGLPGARIRDDAITAMFTGIPGLKLVVPAACFSGGWVGGSSDVQKLDKAILLASSMEHQVSFSWGHDKGNNTNDFGGHNHSIWGGVLVRGLTNRGDGFARADKDTNLKVTVNEWFGYAQPEAKAMAANYGLQQDPLLWANDGGDAGTVIFEYAKGNLHTGEFPVAPKRDAPVSDCGDPVGGIAEPVALSGAASEAAGGGGASAGALGAIAGSVAAATMAVAGGWYARRRWMR